jgi:cytochrome d ubiquinol oxidase subunit I
VAIWWRLGRLPRGRWFHWATVAAGPLSLIALLAGWTVTEVGRQPWVVYRILRTREAVTDAAGLPAAFVAMAVVYILLAVMVAWLLRRIAREEAGEPPLEAAEAG